MKFPTWQRSFLHPLCFLTLLFFSQATNAQDKSPTYAITHAKIFTLSGSTIDDGTVVMQNGKIANVGAAVEVPTGAQVIDGKGLQVYPGLFDPITQMGLREIGAVSATVDSAETGPFNPDVVASEAVLPSSEHIPVTRAAGITEVLAVPASGGLDSEGLTGILAGQASAIHLSGCDLRLEALVPVIRGELHVLVFADKARDIRNAVEFCEKQKLKMILAGGAEAYRVKDLLRSKSIPVILGPTLTLPREEDDAYDRILTQPAELAAAGIKFAFGSFDNSFARRLGQQAANAVAYGLPYDEALKAVTLYPAQIFGLADQVGSLESGKIANVIVTNGDPLELTTEVRYLFIKGQLTSLNNKQKALYEKYLNRPKAQ